MTEQEYIQLFYLLWNHAENEVVEFKRAENGFDVDDLGKYFSANSYIIRAKLVQDLQMLKPKMQILKPRKQIWQTPIQILKPQIEIHY